jgi:hypothetical protein
LNDGVKVTRWNLDLVFARFSSGILDSGNGCRREQQGRQLPAGLAVASVGGVNLPPFACRPRTEQEQARAK